MPNKHEKIVQEVQALYQENLKILKSVFRLGKWWSMSLEFSMSLGLKP